MRSCHSALVTVFKTVINLSLSTGSIPEDLKIASLRPLLKKSNADCEQFSNFRPVSNLKFLSKLVEKSVFAQCVGLCMAMYGYVGLCRAM